MATSAPTTWAATPELAAWVAAPPQLPSLTPAMMTPELPVMHRSWSPPPPASTQCLLSQATWPRCSNCLANINMDAPVFNTLHRATLHEVELCDVAITIINKTAARAWSLEAGYIFFDERLDILVASSLLLALIDTLTSGGHVHNLNNS